MVGIDRLCKYSSVVRLVMEEMDGLVLLVLRVADIASHLPIRRQHNFESLLVTPVLGRYSRRLCTSRRLQNNMGSRVESI